MPINSFFRRSQTLHQFHEGPLGPNIDAYAEQLRVDGYTRSTARSCIRSVAQFSHWLKEQRIPVEQITMQDVEFYCRSRPRCLRPAVQQFLRLFRLGEFSTTQNSSREKTPIELMNAEFARYLEQEIGLVSGTRASYIQFAESFLEAQFTARPIELDRLGPREIIGFVQSEAARVPRSRLQVMTVAIRHFLRFARYRGEVCTDLAACVPRVAHWKQATLPKYLSSGDVQLVLASCKCQTTTGKRDYAVLLLLARLGLRAGEVGGLELGDIDWYNGVITVHGKHSRVSQFPLSTEVGAALADYIQNGRQRVSSKRIFLRAVAPVRPLRSPGAISDIAKRALGRANVHLPCKGAHVFRHTLATHMLRHGASLSEIGSILGHQSPDTTAIYAKVDLKSLRSIALAWPGGGL
jgi:integrase/recombinase XerD